MIGALAVSSMLTACSGDPSVEWTDTDGFSLTRSRITDHEISLTFHYAGPCERSSGDLKYSWRVSGEVISDDEIAGPIITRDLPPVQRDHERRVTFALPLPLPRAEIEGVIVRLVDSRCTGGGGDV